MQFVQEHSNLNPKTLDEIRSYVKNHDGEFQPSMVYETEIEERLIKKESRSSVFRLLHDKELFNLCNEIVQEINKISKDLKFFIYQNDITHIKYSVGDYFKSHEDYLSMTSNIINEYTMIICINSDGTVCIGGETILHINDFFVHKSKTSITPKNCLIFRKDIIHEGSVISKGSKEIITLNLWGFNNEGKIVIITFTDTESNYIISQETILNSPDNVLKSYIDFKSDVIGPLEYKEMNYTYEDFSIINEIYLGKTINMEDVHKYSEIIDYYGFDFRNILAKSFSYILPKSIKSKPETHNKNIILIGSSNEHNHFLEDIKENCLPYIPFKMLMAEGNISYGGGMSGTPPTKIDMQPLWVSFSERNNVMFYIGTSTQDFKGNTIDIDDIVNVNDVITDKNKKFKFSCDIYDDEDESTDNESTDTSGDEVVKIPIDEDTFFMYERSIKNFNLKLCLEYENPIDIINLITRSHHDRSCNTIFNNKYDENPLKTTPHYVIDSDNKLSLNSKNHSDIYKFIEKHDLYNYVAKHINTIDFEFNQYSSKTTNFCNETTYENLNFLMVYGFIKIDDL